MTINAAAYLTVSPHFMEPALLVQYSQASGFTDLWADHELRVRMAEDDLLVYMKQINVRTKIGASQSSFNELPGVDISTQMLSTASYLLQVRSEYNHHDVAAGARWGFAVPEAYRLGMRQANAQLARDFGLYGANPQNGEGVVNAPGVTTINLPPDANGNDTVVTYDNGQAAFFLMQEALNIKTNTYQLGPGRKFTVIGPQRILGLWQYNVVQLVQYQRVGAGTASTKELFEKVLMDNGDEVIWTYDDTLKGKGEGGSDLVIMAMTEVEPLHKTPIDTNIFATLTPGAELCLTQYADMAAPREIVSPLPGGATDVLSEWRITSGWVPRPQAVTLISMVYSD